MIIRGALPKKWETFQSVYLTWRNMVDQTRSLNPRVLLEPWIVHVPPMNCKVSSPRHHHHHHHYLREIHIIARLHHLCKLKRWILVDDNFRWYFCIVVQSLVFCFFQLVQAIKSVKGPPRVGRFVRNFSTFLTLYLLFLFLYIYLSDSWVFYGGGRATAITLEDVMRW